MAVNFARIGLSDTRRWLTEQIGERAIERPDRDVDAGAARGRQQIAPADDHGLADLVAAERPEHRAGGRAARGRAIAAPVQTLPGLEPEAVEQLSPAAPAGPSRIERARERDLLGLRRDLVEIAPATLAEARESRGEVLDARLLRIGGGQADREIEADHDRSVTADLLESEPEVLECADRRRAAARGTRRPGAAPPAPSSACRGCTLQSACTTRAGALMHRRATMNRRRKGNSVRPSVRLG